jgi:hypothetical protein
MTFAFAIVVACVLVGWVAYLVTAFIQDFEAANQQDKMERNQPPE